MEATYKDLQAVRVESGRVSALFLPRYGGKLASLRDRESGREFLAQAPGEHYRTPRYGGDYTEFECSGFDDMFPTIDPVCCMQEPWKGVEMPDHGEVYALPWDRRETERGLLLSTHGVRFPYRLQKEIYFETETALCLEYTAENLSPFPWEYLWAAHLMLRSEEGGKAAVSYTPGDSVTCVFSIDPAFGERGDKLRFPLARRADGGEQDLCKTGEKRPDGLCYKYYFDRPFQEGEFRYQYPDGAGFRLTFGPREALPYMGVWVNEGGFHGLQCIAPEVCTSAFDRPDVAKLYGKCAVLEGYGKAHWKLCLEICEKGALA